MKEKEKKAIESVLDAFNIGHGEVTSMEGPTVTLYEFDPATGVRLSKIRNLKDEFSVALKTQGVRVIAPNDNGMVSLEVPNKERKTVEVTEMLLSEDYKNTDMELPLAIGRKVDGSMFMTDLAKMPHLLVAGATGMGKSVGLNAILMSLLFKRTPDELKLVLIDPKQVELSVYESISKQYIAHLEGKPAICTEVDDAQKTLDAVIRLMEDRYAVLKEKGVRNIQEYNLTADVKMPYYVVVIDEYGDLIMQVSGKDMEKAICRIAQKARAVGIHMIISTQRPATKIVTGSIKANFPTRIAFRTTTGTDSRVVLDKVGAERLTGKGDMLFFQGAELIRCQCAYIGTDEVREAIALLSSMFAHTQETFLPGKQKKEYSEAYMAMKKFYREYFANI